MISSYDLVIMFNPKLEAADQKKITDNLGQLIEKADGKVGEVVDWGKKQLAYPIKKLSQATFNLISFSAEREAMEQLVEKLKREEQVIRYLLIKTQAVKKGKK